MSDKARTGLTSAQAEQLLRELGPNVVAGKPPVSAMRVFMSQFGSVVVWFLVAAAAVSAAVGELVDASAIAAIVALNAVIGFVQEYRAERAIEALRAMTAPKARVRRDGVQMTIDGRSVVDGDLLVVEAGDVIAADGVVVESHGLSVNEAVLTGESVPVTKRVDADEARERMVFMGSAVSTGSALVEVARTGMKTELGGIARMVTEAEEEETPLRRRVNQLTRTLIVVSCAVVAVIATVSVLRGVPATEIFLAAVSLAVAAVPEGLPAVVTVALALGVRRMAKRDVLVRKLDAVETLGSTTVICTDKTGTLTTGVMTLRDVWGADHRAVIAAAAACCDAELSEDGATGFGDPTEVAIVAAAAQRGIRRADIERDNPRVETHAFDDVRRRMAVLRADDRLYVKGAVESVLPLCATGTDGALDANATLGARGLRVLAVAIGQGNDERGLTFLGLIGIADPPRNDAMSAVADAYKAGIVTVMITGDHAATARAIATELGIVDANGEPAERVHARITPRQKLEIVRARKASGAIVAMTGDGVNDAPALREAHIGIAMGKGGTAVAREAADIVLVNDDFASIVHAVREGRNIFDAIRRSLVYLLSGNVAELGFMLVASLAGWPLPLVPMQLLWINLVTDGLPALGLITLPASADVMTKAPRPVSEPLLGRAQWSSVGASAILQVAASAAFFYWALDARGLADARSLTFGLVVACELFRALARIGLGRGTRPLRSALPLVGIVVISLFGQGALYAFAPARELFALQPLALTDALVCVVVAAVVAVILDLTVTRHQ